MVGVLRVVLETGDRPAGAGGQEVRVAPHAGAKPHGALADIGAMRALDGRRGVFEILGPFGGALPGVIAAQMQHRAEEVAGKGMQRRAIDRLAVARFQQLAAIHDHGPVAELPHDLEVMRDKQIGQPQLSAFGRGDVVQIGGWSTGLLTQSGRKALLMPVITLAVFQVSMIMRLVQGEMQEVMRADFIKFARARGLPDRSIHLRHALRNSLLPVVTVVGMQIGSLIAFAIVCEAVFQWPGLGLLILQAIEYADFPVMAAYLALVGFGFAMINLTVDIIYLFIDPRMRHR